MAYAVLTTALAALRETADGLPDDLLGLPTPCTTWTVAQVLFHAAADQHAWAASVGGGAPPSYDPFDPPHSLDVEVDAVVGTAIDAATAAWQRADGPSLPTPLPPVPTLPPALAAAACALDAAVHAWDVAVATGRRPPLTPELAEDLMPAARATAEPLRGFAYAAPLAPRADDDPAAALLRYLGRDPAWRP